MANGIRTVNPRGFSKGRSSKFHEGSQVQQTPEGRRTYRPKRCGNNKDEDNSPKTLCDKNINTVVFMFRNLQENVAHEFAHISSAVPKMFCSSYLDGF